MKRITFLAMFVAMVLGASAQYHIHLWMDGEKMSYPVLNLDSITFTNDATEEPGEPDPGTPDTPEEPETPTAGIGVFSVGEGKTVTFSPGNLQYTQSTNTWSFAENQWDMIGTDNVMGGSVESDPKFGDSKYGDALADKIDLFGWSASNTTAPFGVSTSLDWENDYLGSFVDWGTNQIGADAPNTWRTLTKDEWEYLLNNRPNASSLKGIAQVNGVNGLILLPDNWTCPAGVTFKSGFHSSYGVDYYAAYQTFTAAEWSKLESAGAVFLPASGDRYGSDVYDVQYSGNYWSVTEYDGSSVYYLDFRSDVAGMYGNYRNYGLFVRLVKDIEGGGATPDTPDTPTEPEEPTNPSAGIGVFSVSADKQVTFSQGNLQYHPANNVWQFAANQTDYIGDANSNIAADYDGWIDLFGWGTGDAPTKTISSYSEYSTFVDWGTNKIGNDAPNTWRTLTNEEWDYLFNNRNNANDLYGVAQVNDVNGLIFLPDNWTCPAGVTFKSGFHVSSGANYYAAYQTFTADQWSKLEKSGAVFLPAAGYRDFHHMYVVQRYGHYWSATLTNSQAMFFLFDSDEAYVYDGYRRRGFSVRLVKDVE